MEEEEAVDTEMCIYGTSVHKQVTQHRRQHGEQR